MAADALIPILAAIAGALIMRGIEAGWRWMEERRGSLHGEWWQYIPADGKRPFRLDHVACKHVGDVVSATISRVEPAEQGERQWAFRGYVRRSMVFGAFFSNDPYDLSYGTILLRVDSDDSSTWDGFYNRLSIDHDGAVWREEIVQVPLYWSRLRHEGSVGTVGLASG